MSGMKQLSLREAKAARHEVSMARVPEEIVDKFVEDGDVGAFRYACRQCGVPEDVIDVEVNAIEKREGR